MQQGNRLHNRRPNQSSQYQLEYKYRFQPRSGVHRSLTKDKVRVKELAQDIKRFFTWQDPFPPCVDVHIVLDVTWRKLYARAHSAFVMPTTATCRKVDDISSEATNFTY